jgi:uncharacterized protein DUF5916/cellulose/xylan binding protein with CBM9 domain
MVTGAMTGKFVLAVGAMLAEPVVAQQAGRTAQQEGDRPVIRAERTPRSIGVDGRLDEAIWMEAAPATEFTQRDPDEGAPATQRTEVRIVYDDDALYVGARLSDSGAVSTRLGRRDSSLPGSDWFTIIFDSYHDHLTAYQFSVNPSGVRQDQRTGEEDEDESWDPVWEAATQIDAQGWTAELRIPLSQLRFRDQHDQIWGVQLQRSTGRNNEEAWFAFTPKRERSGVARYGHLEGLAGLRPSSPLELLPYGLTRALYRTEARDPDIAFPNPFFDGSDFTTAFGLDMKYRLASNLTLDATFNPDFGQIEADPATINLTAFETQFDERRPFFIEGSDIFDFGGSRIFYSRRIGGPPLGRLPDGAVYDDMPDNSTIVGAAKLTGKIGGWSVGVMEAMTGREHAAFITEAGDRGDALVAPLANFFASRVRHELREGESVVGGIVTAVHRDLSDDALARRARSNAYTLGLDFTHSWQDRSWSLDGFLVGSRIAGRPDAITLAQRSSARYFHRPDADHLELDPAARTLSGFAAGLSLDKEAGLHWRGFINYETTSPGYEVNDLGFQSRADQHSFDLGIDYVEERPGRVFREWNIDASLEGAWNYGGDRLGTGLDVEIGAELLNYWSGEFNLSREFASFDDRLTRGGPLARQPALTGWFASVRSDERKPWQLDISGDYESGPVGRSTSFEVEIGYRPSPRWNITMSPEWSRENVRAQYIETIPDSLARATFGSRYVFADLEQSEVSLATGLSVTFTPGMTLEVFARPFLGSGKFGRPRELVAPRTYRFADYDEIGTVRDLGEELEVDPDGAGPAEPFEIEKENFTLRSLRGNAVLRWEWRPGSTLFLVWQQEREAETSLTSDLRLRRDLRALYLTRPENVFMVKVSYWFSP